MPGIGAECRRIGAAAMARHFNDVAAVGFCHQAAKSHSVAVKARMTGNGGAARTAKRGEKSAFGGKRSVGVGIVDGGGMRTRALVAGARLDSDGALARRRQKLFDRERGGDRRKQSEPL